MPPLTQSQADNILLLAGLEAADHDLVLGQIEQLAQYAGAEMSGVYDPELANRAAIECINTVIARGIRSDRASRLRQRASELQTGPAVQGGAAANTAAMSAAEAAASAEAAAASAAAAAQYLSGASISAQDEGTALPGPITTINAVGDGISAGLANGVLTLTVTGGGGGQNMHNLLVGWAPGGTQITGPYIATDGVEIGLTGTGIIPLATGDMTLYIWRAAVDGGAPTEVHISGGGNQRNAFGQASDVTVGTVPGELIQSVTTQNASLLGGEQIRIV